MSEKECPDCHRFYRGNAEDTCQCHQKAVDLVASREGSPARMVVNADECITGDEPN